jgi:mannose-6-phosphate isomerase-like protein (cupin superfamily)
MAVQKWRSDDCVVLSNKDVQSRQLVWPSNAPESQTTITHVTMAPGAVSERHRHEASEQIWIVVRGEGALLLANEQSEALRAGDVVRTPAGDVHGIVNSGVGPLEYFAFTTPPQDFSYAYKEAVSAKGG